MKVKLSFDHKDKHSFGSEQSFCHFLNKSWNQKISFTKVVQFGMLFENVSKEVKDKRLFGRKAFILSLSKLIIESKDFFLQSCSLWYAI